MVKTTAVLPPTLVAYFFLRVDFGILKNLFSYKHK